MSRFASPAYSTPRLLPGRRTSSPRIRAELKPLGSLRLFVRPEPTLPLLWAPERLARLHEPLSRYHD